MRVGSDRRAAGRHIVRKRPLVWAPVQLVYDSPDKKSVERGEMVGELMHKQVADAHGGRADRIADRHAVSDPGRRAACGFSSDLRKRGVQVRILTNSLESTPELLAHAGYMHYRIPLLEDGVELYEVRALLGDARGSGESPADRPLHQLFAAREIVRVRSPEAVRRLDELR